MTSHNVFGMRWTCCFTVLSINNNNQCETILIVVKKGSRRFARDLLEGKLRMLMECRKGWWDGVKVSNVRTSHFSRLSSQWKSLQQGNISSSTDCDRELLLSPYFFPLLRRKVNIKIMLKFWAFFMSYSNSLYREFWFLTTMSF